ncbi:hypothetical protein BK653_05015 [Pseudomonas brassicacearum]|nr:hypothetical protein BK653_05015 [Pseudomonas brassicacearum]
MDLPSRQKNPHPDAQQILVTLIETSKLHTDIFVQIQLKLKQFFFKLLLDFRLLTGSWQMAKKLGNPHMTSNIVVIAVYFP